MGEPAGGDRRWRGAETSTSVDRALEILFCIALRGPQRIVDLVVSTGLDRRSIGRFLASLTRAGLVRREERTHRYELGAALIHLGHIAQQRAALLQLARPRLSALVAETGCTTLLHVRHGSYLRPLIVLTPPHTLAIHYPLGRQVSLWQGIGRVYVANLPDGERQRVQRQAPSLMSDAALEQARADGYVVSLGEVVPSITAVGAPVLDRKRYPIGVVAIIGLAESHPEHFTREVVAAAQAISDMAARSDWERDLNGSAGHHREGEVHSEGDRDVKLASTGMDTIRKRVGCGERREGWVGREDGCAQLDRPPR
jgi:IclR family acetate operon transcriptional repressor